MDEKPRSILKDLLSQVKVGMDLTKVRLPTFILEPRSLLEKLADFLTHSQLLLSVPDHSQPIDRMVAIVQWYLSGWHTRPRGIRKPYNPILGEVFFCKYSSEEHGTTKFVAEQVSHHPPISAFYVENTSRKIVFTGSLWTRSKFLGNSAASILEGESTLRLLSFNEDYVLTWPTAYVRHLFMGKLFMEIGGEVKIMCRQTGIVCDIEFKTKGLFSGDLNRVTGNIKKDGHTVYTIDGHWDSVINIEPKTKGSESKSKTGQSLGLSIDIRQLDVTPKIVLPEEEQLPFESKRLWKKLTQALNTRDYDAATIEKNLLEDSARSEAQARETKRINWEQRLFKLDNSNKWAFKGGDAEVALRSKTVGATSTQSSTQSLTPSLRGSSVSAKAS